jgi:hypothetical protein
MEIKICNEISKTISPRFCACEKVVGDGESGGEENPSTRSRMNNESGRSKPTAQRGLEVDDSSLSAVSLIRYSRLEKSFCHHHRHSHESLVAGSDLLDENVIF